MVILPSVLPVLFAEQYQRETKFLAVALKENRKLLVRINIHEAGKNRNLLREKQEVVRNIPALKSEISLVKSVQSTRTRRLFTAVGIADITRIFVLLIASKV